MTKDEIIQKLQDENEVLKAQFRLLGFKHSHHIEYEGVSITVMSDGKVNIEVDYEEGALLTAAQLKGLISFMNEAWAIAEEMPKRMTKLLKGNE